MKSNELRVGNLISITPSAHKDDIEAVTINMLEQIDNGYKVFGIPITEEWLLKYGFENTNKDWFSKSFSMKVNESTNDYKIAFNTYSKLINTNWKFQEMKLYEFEKHITTLEYVHQLQNLYLSITHTELTSK